MNKKRIQQIKCLFTLFFVVCASFYATRSYAQNNAVTIRLSGVSMERVMNEIENQTNYLFLSNKDVDINSVVSVDVEARPLSEALAQMVRGTDVVYRFDGKYILLSKADRRPVTVKGVVTDADGAPVIGASVIVKGTTVGASTNTDGSFSLQVPPPAENAVLIVTYLGYEPVDVTVGSRTDFRTRSRTQSGAAELDVDVSLGALQCLMVRIGSDELNALGAVGNHVLDGISAAATHADHLDHGFERVKFRKNFKRHVNLVNGIGELSVLFGHSADRESVGHVNSRQ